MTDPRQIAIVGAGLVGSLWAVLLQQRGFQVDLYEKRADPRLKSTAAGRSINLVITSRGLYGLQKAGLREKALKLALPVYGRMIHPRAGELAYQAYGRDGECNFSISRGELNKFLIEEAEKSGTRLHFEHSPTEIDFKKKQIGFSNSKTASYDLLFGADGAGSLIRKALSQQDPKQFQQSTDWLAADYKELLLPTKKDGTAALDPKALHIWPRGSHMLMGLANLDGSFTMTLYLPKEKATWSFSRLKTDVDIQQLFEEEFPDTLALMPDFLSDFKSHPEGSLGTVRTSKWTDGESVALLGDAAHAIVPFFGQGMNLGFEDTTTLLRFLEENKNDWAKALKAYDEFQRPNAHAIAEMALENWAEMRDRVGDPQFLLRKKVEGILEKEFPQEYRSRYGMITYTLVPYALAQQAGQVQEKMLQELCSGLASADGLDLKKSHQLIQRDFLPFVEKNKINLEKYL